MLVLKGGHTESPAHLRGRAPTSSAEQSSPARPHFFRAEKDVRVCTEVTTPSEKSGFVRRFDVL